MNDIVAYVLSDCARFRPETKFIKENIEYLIVKDYLERDSDDPTLFKYIA
jgi:cullin 1